MLNLNLGSLMSYVMSSTVEEKIGAFIKDNNINHYDTFSIILKGAPSGTYEKLIRVLGEPVHDGEDQYWFCENFILTKSIRPTHEFRELHFAVYCNLDQYGEIKKSITKKFEASLANLEGIVQVAVDWYFIGKNGMDSYNLTEVIKEVVYPEAYPEIEDLDGFISGYFGSTSPILILTGPPGTGKSRLIRYIVMKYAMLHADEADVMYTSDMNLLEKEEAFFISFRVGDDQFMILEDIDSFLQPRKEGNELMHKFLSASDGFLRCDAKKIIMTTNLSLNEIDEALIRPGRCYSRQEFGKLNQEQAISLARRINKKGGWTIDDFSAKRYSLAEIYDIAVDKDEAKLIEGNEKPGFNSPRNLGGRQNAVGSKTSRRGY